jgi:DNA-binding response OmpR family regulator
MSLRVLVVDDNRELAENVAEILEVEGYEALVADDPHEALRLARETYFDAAIIDVRMPGMDGITLHSELARLHPCAAFVLMTAYTRDERIEEALRAGVSAVLPKPVPVGELLAELPAPGTSGAEILLVEDDTDLGGALAEALRDEGFRPRCVTSIAAAWRSMQEAPPAAVVSDVRLPDGDGATFARELHEHSKIPVVLMTAFDTEEAEQIVKQYYGARGRLLTKPFSTEALLAALGAVREGSSGSPSE